MKAIATVLAAAMLTATPVGAAEIDLENLDVGTPYHDRLAFSRINGGVTTHEFHELVKLRIKNLSGDALVISNLAIVGGDTTYFTLPNGELTTPPAPIAAGGFYDLDVKFQAGTSATTKATRQSTLVITSNDADEGTLVVELAGFNLAQPEGNNEPSLQQLLDVFGYKTQITYAGQSLNQNGWVRAVGDEVISPYWQRANTALPVFMIQLAAYHSQGNTATFRWFNKGSGSQTNIITMRGVEAQSVLPHRNGSTTLLSNATFTPSGSVFGFGCDGERSDPALNNQTTDQSNGCPTPCGHHFRTWPVRDRNGALIPNTYIMSMDYSGINYDYNDNMYLVSNIRPELIDRDVNIPGLFPGSPGLVREFNQAYAGTLLDAQGETVGFPDTQRNKNDNTAPHLPPGDSYDAAALDINTGGAGTLTVTTSTGSNATNDNTLVNGLCLPFDGRGGAPFVVTSTILGPLTNITTANQQGGVMFGPNQDNYVKMVVIGTSGNRVLQLHAEQNGTGANVGATVAISNAANVSSTVLSLVADPRDGKVRGRYTINYTSGSPVTGTMPGVLTLTGTQYNRFFDRRAKGCLITTHKSTSQIQLVFDRFAIESGEAGSARPSVTRVNVGGPAYTDTLGNLYSVDTGLYTPGTAPAEGGAVIAVANTLDDPLYYHYRGNVGSVPQAQRILTFNIPVGINPRVDARIHFAELHWGAPGGGAAGPVKRIFDISAEGVKWINDFDITAASGAARTAVVVPMEGINVADGTLTLSFAADLDYPAVSAIEVLIADPECAVAADCTGSPTACQQLACIAGQCVTQNLAAGTACTSDGNQCTNDQCDGSGTCLHINNTGPCNDGLFCNGADTCLNGSCSVHAGNPCTGGAECLNVCNEAADNCVAPAGTPCSDEPNPCTNDACNGAGNCAHIPNANPCDDGLFCNGADTCNGGTCSLHSGNPCASGSECADNCSEAGNHCFDLPGSPCTDDGNPCTDDQCNGFGTCTHPNNTAPCSDGIFCNGADTCSGGSCSGHAGDPCAGGPECANTCNEAGSNCFRPAGSTCSSDGNVCTDDLCDGSGSCAHVFDVSNDPSCATVTTTSTLPGEDCLETINVVVQTKSTSIKLSPNPESDRIKTGGAFLLPEGALFMPNLSAVKVTVRDTLGSYYEATIPEGRFVGSSSGRSYKFKDNLMVHNGMRQAKMSVGSDGRTVRYKFSVQRRDLPDFATGIGGLTVQLGSICYSDTEDVCLTKGAGVQCR
jgi:hypothetical protein